MRVAVLALVTRDGGEPSLPIALERYLQVIEKALPALP
jgi:hypothetical protein